MLQIDHNSRKPIYEQICEQTMMLISSGLLVPDEKMPSVRLLSVTLNVNPNTIQRAYTDLTNLGVLYSIGGKGCFVANDAKQIILKKAETELSQFNAIVEKMRISGVTAEKLKQEIDKIYSNGGNEND